MRQTQKLVAAKALAQSLSLDFPDEQLYDSLQDLNYFWDSKLKEWYLAEEALPPTKLL